MGKASKKVKRQAQKKADVRKLQQCQPKETALITAFESEEYTQVLEILAELIQANDIKPEFLYKGAYSYFMLGDYDRAAQWVNNTLNYDSKNVDARILLARLCFIQDRHDDGLAIYDFLTAHFLNGLTREQKEQIGDSAEYYVRRDRKKIQQKYPHLADFLQVQADVPYVEKEDIADTPISTEGSAVSALQRLKAKLQSVQEKNERLSVETNASSNQHLEQEVCLDSSAEKKIAEIQNRTCSMREKVQLLNKFSAASFVADDYQEAESYLKAALQLDDGDSQTIRNMAMIQSVLGRVDMAQALVAKLPEVDFAFLYLLKEMSKGYKNR